MSDFVFTELFVECHNSASEVGYLKLFSTEHFLKISTKGMTILVRVI